MVGRAAKKTQPRRLERVIRHPGNLSPIQRLCLDLVIQAAAFEQTYLERRTLELARQRYARCPGTDDADIRVDDRVLGNRTCVNEHGSGQRAGKKYCLRAVEPNRPTRVR